MQKELLKLLKKFKKLLSRSFDQYNDKLVYVLTALIAGIIFIGGIKLFIALTEVLKSEYLASYDSSISTTIENYRDPALTKYFTFVTDLGDTYGYLIVFSICSLLFYLFLKRWKDVLQLSLIMILALSSNLLLKQIVNRARPDVEHLVTVETLSYPSGHAMMAMAFYGLLIYVISKFQLRKIYKLILMSICILLILSIGMSRIYLGVHYPSDVAGGFIAGFIWVVFCVMIFSLIKIFRRDPAT